MVLCLLKKLFGGGTTCGANSSITGEADPARFVELVVRNLVTEPAAVKIVAADKGTGGIEISISCSKADMGRIIGKRGRAICAIRTLASEAGSRIGKKVSVDIND